MTKEKFFRIAKFSPDTKIRLRLRYGRYSTATRLEQQASFCAFDLDKTAHIYKGKIETFIVGNQNRWWLFLVAVFSCDSLRSILDRISVSEIYFIFVFKLPEVMFVYLYFQSWTKKIRNKINKDYIHDSIVYTIKKKKIIIHDPKK